ncbi:MAG: PIN domain-containing protein [Gaiellaceae bacterium MAG52_C11]|nr:PIN domain-containing protein [Candidatus Gaiellasilicea maunaloa]
MTLILDTSGLLAAMSAGERRHEAALSVIVAAVPPLVLSPFVLAELDYMITTREGIELSLSVLADVTAGAYEVAGFDADDVGAAAAVVEQYRDLGIGLADASLVVLAERYDTRRILTLDERHFRALRASDGSAFVLLPADA